jgi:parallel beta-helix repeat protein
VVVRNLNLDGSRSPKCAKGDTCNILPSPIVNANDTRWINNDITNRHTAICFNVGSSAQETARGTLIKNNRIHNCGRLPATNHDHGIYLNFAKATQIFGNTIYDNADRGIQLRANADGTIIKRNVIDGNGQGLVFSGAFGEASDNTTVRYNVITFSTDRYDVEAWYPDGNPQGAGNSVYSNCIYGGNQGEIKSSNGGFTARDNAFEDPLYADRANHNYVVRNNGCPAVWDGIPDAGHR